MLTSLLEIAYVLALFAAAIIGFGPGGIVIAALVWAFWVGWCNRPLRYWPWGRILILVAVVGALIAPALRPMRTQPLPDDCAHRMRQIVQALLKYKEARGTFPPASVSDGTGTFPRSWRVKILPLLEQQALLDLYDVRQPWDGPNNSKLAAYIPDVFRCPQSDGAETSALTEAHYLAVIGPQTAWPAGKSLRARAPSGDATRTIAIIEATGLGIHWMEPRDLTLDEAVKLLTTAPQTGHLTNQDGFLATKRFASLGRNVAFCDGQVQWVGWLDDAEIARTLLTISDGKTLPVEIKWNYPVAVTVVVNWQRVCALGVFAILALLPLVWLRRRKALPQPDGDVAP